MHNLLSKLHEQLLQFNKSRKIYFIDNVKFHLDTVEGLGSFLEIEAINMQDQKPDFLRNQCLEYLLLFEIKD